MRTSVRNNLAAMMRTWGKLFLITLFFVSAASALFFLDLFRGYEAEVRLMVIGRSAAVDTDRAAANLAALVGTLPFYDRVVADDILDDPFAGYPQAERRARWNASVSAEHQSGSGLIVVTVSGEDPDEARQLAARVAKTLFGMAGLYYDVKEAIDIRAIDGPVASTVLRHPVMYALTSLAAGAAVTVIFFGVLIVIPEVIGQRRRISDTVSEEYSAAYGVGDAVPYIDPRKFIPIKPAVLPYEEAEQEEIPAMQPSAPAKAAAPDNLPIADDAFPIFQEEMIVEESVPEAEPMEMEMPAEAPDNLPIAEPVSEEPAEYGEPTVEEYKRRLNELLAGGR